MYDSVKTLTIVEYKSIIRMVEGAHIVPATRVLMCVFLSSYSFAKPKSDIFGQSSASRRILLALTSLCTILGLESS